jgi:hypothetical protein
VPKIPSLPISYEDALPLLKSLNGHGIKLGGKKGHKEGGLEYLGVEYWTGPGPDVAHLVNEMDDKVTAMWNTYAVIPGLISDEVVVLGNHNDAWTFGAGDPNSGTASVHEVVKGLGELLKTGWKPLRTILVAVPRGASLGLPIPYEDVIPLMEWLGRRAFIIKTGLDHSREGEVNRMQGAAALGGVSPPGALFQLSSAAFPKDALPAANHRTPPLAPDCH